MNAEPNPADAVMNYARDARDKLRGRTRYTIDQVRPGMLHAALCRADVPSGRIRGIDAEAAKRIPGVRAVATAEDAPGMYGIGIADHPLLAKGVIRYVGEPIAAVAADTLEQARAAAAAIVVDVEPTPALLTMEEALAPNARLIHEDWKAYEVLLEGAARGGNIAWEATVRRGDTDSAFTRPDVTIVESCFRVGRQSHVPFEPRAAVASYEDGRFHILASTQVPWTVRKVTALALGVSEARVRVTVPPVGGGFELKFDASIEPIAALLARATGGASRSSTREQRKWSRAFAARTQRSVSAPR